MLKSPVVWFFIVNIEGGSDDGRRWHDQVEDPDRQSHERQPSKQGYIDPVGRHQPPLFREGQTRSFERISHIFHAKKPSTEAKPQEWRNQIHAGNRKQKQQRNRATQEESKAFDFRRYPRNPAGFAGTVRAIGFGA